MSVTTNPSRPVTRRLGALLVGGGLTLAALTSSVGLAATAAAAPATTASSTICQGLTLELRELQAELRVAPTGQKAYIITEIRAVLREMRANGC